MWFDVQAAVANIESDEKTVVEAYPPAISAILANSDNLDTTFTSRLAEIAEIAAGDPKSPNPVKDAVTGDCLVLQAIRGGNVRHGTVATTTGIGATVTYQLLDKLIASGQVIQARDGILSEGAKSNDKP